MAARKQVQPARPSLLKIMLLVLLCVSVGGTIVFWGSPKIRELLRNGRERGGLFHLPQPKAEATKTPGKAAGKAMGKVADDLKKPALPQVPEASVADDKPEAAPEATPEPATGKTKTTQLERENKRLREDLAAKERENTDLKIQLKLLQEGSRSRDAK